jgi:hypothetical protein
MKKKPIKKIIASAINKLAPKSKKAAAARPADVPTKPADPQVAASPNHVSNAQPKAQKKLTNVARARKRLIERHGYEEDELKSLFKTDDELLAFYNDVVNAPTDSDTEDEIGWDLTDAMDAPIADKERYTRERREQQVRAYEQLQAQQAAAAAAKAAAAAAPSPSPAGGSVGPAVPDVPADARPEPAAPALPAKPAKSPQGKTGPAPVSAEQLKDLGLTLEEFLAAGDDLDSMFRD